MTTTEPDWALWRSFAAVVAEGSLMGVVLMFWANGGSILNKLLGG